MSKTYKLDLYLENDKLIIPMQGSGREEWYITPDGASALAKGIEMLLEDYIIENPVPNKPEHLKENWSLSISTTDDNYVRIKMHRKVKSIIMNIDVAKKLPNLLKEAARKIQTGISFKFINTKG